MLPLSTKQLDKMAEMMYMCFLRATHLAGEEVAEGDDGLIPAASRQLGLQLCKGTVVERVKLLCQIVMGQVLCPSAGVEIRHDLHGMPPLSQAHHVGTKQDMCCASSGSAAARLGSESRIHIL